MSEVLGSKDPARERKALEVLSCLIKHGAQPSPRQASLVGSKAGFEAARKCFLDAVCGAVNPLLVGMRLSLLMADAGGMGNEGQRQVCASPCLDVQPHSFPTSAQRTAEVLVFHEKPHEDPR